MTGLETRVREALIDQRADELVRYTLENPEYKAMITAIVPEVVEMMIDSTMDLASTLGEVDEEEMAEMIQKYKKEVLPKIQASIDNPKQLKQMMYEQARNQWKSVRQLKAKLKQQVADLKKDCEISAEVVTEYERAYDGVIEFVRTNDRIVRRLTKIAETEGVDKATQKETRYAITREMFPTPEEYRTFAQRGIEVVRNFFQQAQSALMADGEMGQDLGRMVGVIGKRMEKIQEIGQKSQEDYLENTIQEIYG